MSSTTVQPVPTETDKQRADRIVAGRTRKPSRTTRAAAKSKSDKSTPKPAPAPQPAQKSEPTHRDLQHLVFAALMRAAGDIVDNPPAGVTKQQARAILAQRQRYVPRAAELWDLRLGPKPTK
jgi:hypothetical protein